MIKKRMMMKTIYTIVGILLFVIAFVHAESVTMRAPRTDALSFAGSPPQIISPEYALLAQIKQCVCNLNTALQDCCSVLDVNIDSAASAIENDLEHIIDVLGGISNLETPISSFEILFSLVDSLNISLIETLIETIQGLNSSFDHVTSLIDYDIEIDQTTLSKLFKIDTQTEAIISLVDLLVNQNCASANDVLASDIDVINSSIDRAILLADQILDMDQTIASKAGKIDTQLDAVHSLIDVAMLDCASRSDVVIHNLELLQEQETSCCAELFSQIDVLQADINSRFAAIETSLEGLSNVEVLISQLEILTSVIDNIDTAIITSLIDTTQSGFDVITSRLDTPFQCRSIPIVSPMTITAPGNYCLDHDITGNIIIASSDVTLNLNEHTISGSVVINTGISNIIVANGFIDGMGSTGVVMNGFFDTITLMGLYIKGGLDGVSVTGGGATNLYITHVIAENCSNNGYYLAQCSGSVVNCAAYANGTDGFSIFNNGQVFTMQNNIAAFNGSSLHAGFNCQGITSSTLTTFNMESCTAYANVGYGFIFNACNIDVNRCLATENIGTGFMVYNYPSVITNNIVGLIADCISMKNSIFGFNIALSSLNFSLRYVGNYAVDNISANYAMASATVAKNASPYYWLSWKNDGAGRRINIDGNDLS